MTSQKLVAWRHTHRYTKLSLAKALGVHRNTVNRWEAGTFTIPPDLAARLAAILDPTEVPAIVCAAHAHLRPDLKLYLPSPRGRGQYVQDREHPCRLLGVEHPAPWSVLETVEYLHALELHRASRKTSRTPSALTKIMGAAI